MRKLQSIAITHHKSCTINILQENYYKVDRTAIIIINLKVTS